MRSLSFIILYLVWTVNLFSQSPHGADLKMDCAACHTPAGWEIPFETWNFDELSKPKVSRMTGMPLGMVTLIVSVIMAIGFFGPRGLFLVSSNAVGLLEHYSLVAVPFFVLMASILERAGIAEDLFDAMSIFSGNLRGGVAVQTTVVAVILAAKSTPSPSGNSTSAQRTAFI